MRFICQIQFFVLHSQLFTISSFLLIYLRLCLLRSGYAPHLVEGVHVERQVIELALVISHWRIGITIELYDGVDELPHLLVRGMEDVCAILMHIDALDALTIDVATQVSTLVYHQALLALFVGKMSECGSVEARAYY